MYYNQMSATSVMITFCYINELNTNTNTFDCLGIDEAKTVTVTGP